MSVEEKIQIQLDCFGPERWTCAACGCDFEPTPDADPDNAFCDECAKEYA